MGTSTALTDINGKAYQFFLNLPFGETMAEQKGTMYYNSPYKFNGKELDEETGWYYYGARYYDPRASIWLSVDPLFENAPGFNPYVYCKQNPTVLVDPDGKYPIFPIPSFHPNFKGLSNLGNSAAKNIKEGIVAAYHETVKQLKRIDALNDKLVSNHVDKEKDGIQFTKQGGTNNTDYRQSNKGNPSSVWDVTPIYTIADYISCDSKIGSCEGAPIEKIKRASEITKKTVEGANLSIDVKETVQESIKKDKKPEQSEYVYIIKDNKNPNNNVQVPRKDYDVQQKK